MRLIALFLLGCLAWAQTPQKDKIVILVSIDGFPAYALEDPRFPVPTIRKFMKEGFSAKRMTVLNPSVTWPNHTGMVTGVSAEKHQVLYNGMLMPGEPRKVDPWQDKSEMVHAKTVYDAAQEAGLTTAQVDWVAIHNAKTITWPFAEVPNLDGVIEKEMIEAGLVTKNDISEFRQAGITWRDEIWTKAAIHIMRKHRPNLMLFHLLNTDSTHHRYGPKSLAGASALSLADARLAELVQAIEDAKLLDKTTFIVTSDHGFKVVRKNIRAGAAVAKAGLKAQVIPEGGTAMVYITDASQTAKIKETLAAIEGVSRVVEPAEFKSMGLPTPQQSDQAPQLVIAAKDGYSFSGGTQEPVIAEEAAPTGSHGYLNTDPEMDALFVAWGRGIPKGKQVERVHNSDIAPTIAELLGLKLEGTEGKSLLR